MSNFLHTFQPSAILISLGPISIYWYGLFMVLAIIAALSISFKLAKYYQIKADILFDLSFWLIINGLIGARLYDDLLQLPYYIHHPLDSLKIWQGGLAIHGAIIAGLLTVVYFAKKHKLSSWSLISLIVPGLALGQAIGRFGNYFNQEIFGLPTSLPWGIPIELINRPLKYLNNAYFQPTFLYESIGCLFIFIILMIFNYYLISKNKLNRYYFIWSVALYMILYSILRFGLEFIRVDEAPIFLGIRWPQFISLTIVFISILLLIFNSHAKERQT